MAESGQRAPMVLRPERGLPSFRRNASLRLENDAIIITDGRGRSRTFRLDGTERAPARIWGFGLDSEGLLDGSGNLLAIWDSGIWGGGAIADFCIAADLKWGAQDSGPVPPLPPGGIKVADFPALRLASGLSAVGIVAYATAQFHAVPDVVIWPIMIVALAGAVTCLLLWRKASRLDTDVAERKRRTIAEALTDDMDDEL